MRCDSPPKRLDHSRLPELIRVSKRAAVIVTSRGCFPAIIGVPLLYFLRWILLFQPLKQTHVLWASTPWMTEKREERESRGLVKCTEWAAVITALVKALLLLCIVFLKMGLRSVCLSPSFFLSLPDNSSRLSNCVFEWSYTAGWNLQSDTENTFLFLSPPHPFTVCLSIHTMPQQSGLSLPPAGSFLQALPQTVTPTRGLLHAAGGRPGSITAVRWAVIDVIISIWADYSWELLIVWPWVE